MTYSLAAHKGILCIVMQDTMDSEPCMLRTFYPSMRGSDGYEPEDIGNASVYPSGQGCFSVRFKGIGFPLDLCLANGGKTLPVHSEKIPIPAPKTKLETRWHNERWERLTKNGWKI